MQEDMAYFLGMLIGGGTLSGNIISIEFPYKGWAHEDFRIDPTWFKESVDKIVPLIKQLLNSDATPRYVPGGTPRYYIDIQPVPTVLYEILNHYDIKPLGELRRHASIKRMVDDMDHQCRGRFVSGLADVIGSCRPTHRHRTLESTTISFEIIGENWKLPYELCQLLYSLGMPVDQILWNHPNMHAGLNSRAYWKKGHKVRVKAGDFSLVGYGLECKKIGFQHLLELESRARGYISKGNLCPNRTYRINRQKVYHKDENSSELPQQVRGHFIHYTHICRALGCPHAPNKWLDKQIPKYI